MIRGTTVSLSNGGATVVFPNGDVIDAVPHDTDSYRDTAERHGYGTDTLRLCQEHELVHLALCDWLGLGESPTFVRILAGETAPCKLNGLEEDAVLAVQRFARAAGIDLIKLMRSKYDEHPRVQGVV